MNSEEPDKFVEGLRRYFDENPEVKPATVGVRAGLSQWAIAKMLSGATKSPKHQTAEKIAKAIGMSVEEVAGHSFDAADLSMEVTSTPLIDVWNVAASAGNGMIAPDHEIVTERLAFPPDFLARLTKTNPRHLAIIGVKGDSMSPTLNDDDIVMLDTSKCNLDWDGIFVLRFGDALHVKRIARGRGDTIQIISDNQNYRAQELPRDEVHPVGRVIWFGKKV
ncbi:phage repressor protein C with HTH and peptisase S24 domain [Gemmobacter caeni]|uniref:Phage repressor protein C with HTH and peptisase S24 domain n=1 Tax=Gemmobacter caeni TaxID=589035 RepID=A0A2T6AP63_9RHOB|nr:LexA family transcriptional regulator [Gemmobacter caeni]PTX45608.1 phage repressor protein C with HTH and peptisase S24 domain [Gemmobacter caeni]TWI93755.1 phage repressor protein C with HTH and peptisase S24 domain [Gemmobacter caeni]